MVNGVSHSSEWLRASPPGVTSQLESSGCSLGRLGGAAMDRLGLRGKPERHLLRWNRVLPRLDSRLQTLVSTAFARGISCQHADPAPRRGTAGRLVHSTGSGSGDSAQPGCEVLFL